MHLIPVVTVPFHCRMSWLHSSWLCLWSCHIGFVMCCSMSICILMILVFLMVHIPLQLMARIFPGSSLYCKRVVILLFLLVGRHFCKCVQLLGSGCIPSQDITSPKNGILVQLKWHFYLISGFLNCIYASPVIGFCCGPYYEHHTPQLECQLLCQTHWQAIEYFIDFPLEDVTCWCYSKE